MYGMNNGEIPSAGKVEMAWVQTPLPPVNLSQVVSSSVNLDHGSIDVNTQESDSTMQDAGESHNAPHAQDRQQELDYDVADDNDWGIN
jgi:RNA-binding protein 26